MKYTPLPILIKNLYTIIVKKGLTLGGFSDNYECGYWGDDTPPRQKRKERKNSNQKSKIEIEKNYQITSDSTYAYLNVMLTPLHLLNDEEQEERTNLVQLYSVETQLEVSYKDSLDIYFDGIFIGSVQEIFEEEKIDNREIINQFCFNEGKLQKIEAFWSGELFYLRVKQP